VDEILLATLACGATLEAAAQKAGVSRGTVQRRLLEPDFRARLQELSADMVKRSSRTLTAASTEAIKTLLALQQSSTPYATRLGAARAILEIGIKLREVADLEERLAAVESRLNERDSHAPASTNGEAGNRPGLAIR
jgi:hypothetical protein